jgi:hypothetical protein
VLLASQLDDDEMLWSFLEQRSYLSSYDRPSIMIVDRTEAEFPHSLHPPNPYPTLFIQRHNTSPPRTNTALLASTPGLHSTPKYISLRLHSLLMHLERLPLEQIASLIPWPLIRQLRLQSL